MKGTRYMKSKFYTYVILIIIIFNLPLNSEEKMRIAILDLREQGVSRRIAMAISNMLRNDFINVGKFTIVERNQMDEIMKEQGFQQTGCTNRECAVKIGKLLSTQKILVGEVVSIGTTTIITVRIIDVEKGVSEYAAKEKVTSEYDIDKAASKITKRLTARITDQKIKKIVKEDRVTQKEPEKTGEFIDKDYYMRGIVPGWGQYYAGNKIKGYFFMGGFVLTGLMTLYSITNYYDSKSEYEGLGQGTPQSEFDDKYNKYEEAGKLAKISLGIFLVFYVVNWVDILGFNKNTDLNNAKNFNCRNNIFSININKDKTKNIIDRRILFTFGIKF